MTSHKTRFAPSPTGLMHLGNARTALFSALLGDRFLLRIEDTDAERSRSEFVEALLEDLQWMGLRWDEGPRSAEPGTDYFQSQRGTIYDDFYRRLEADDQAYPCFCTPAELEVSRKVMLNAGRPPRYSGRCANLSATERERMVAEGRVPSLRFRVPKDSLIEFDDGVRGQQRFDAADIGDFIIRRADGSAAFFFCNAIDDALMGVTHVVRGEDHLSNTPRQMLILRATGLPIPAYSHISLILGDDGAPLSKRNGSRSIRQLREHGYLPIALLNMLARIGHHYDSEDLLDPQRLKAEFKLDHLGKSPSRFDVVHLDHWQEQAVRSSAPETLWDWLHAETRAIVPDVQRTLFLDVVQRNCVFPTDAHEWARILFTDELDPPAPMRAIAADAGQAYFLAAIDAAQAAGDDFDAFMTGLKERTGAKGKQLFMPLRAALSGRTDGPELVKLYTALSAEARCRRFAEFAGEAQ